MRTFSIFILLFGLSMNLWAQQSAQEAMGKLSFLEGNWQGTAQTTTGPGQQIHLQQHERVEYRLGGKMLLIEGKGFENELLKFNALAIITYNEQQQEYEMTSLLHTGQKTDAYFVEKGENIFEWGFDIPKGGNVKYKITLNEKGQWEETGQYSPDGSQWYPSFYMLLDKE